MANSITLSQSLVDDIAQKITDGTATAEQVVLYTKGLQQLQSGNDFQAVVIGLSQSAVDAIDSANSQFQEDAQDALDTFSQTSTNINTSATNAVNAINTAKDTLVATDAELSDTINALPGIDRIDDEVKIGFSGRNQDAYNWDGPHRLPLVFKPYNNSYQERMIDHPWKAPVMIGHRISGYSTNDGHVFLLDHDMQVIDEIGLQYNGPYPHNGGQNAPDYYYGGMPYGIYNARWLHIHNYYSLSSQTAASSGNNNTGTMTGYLDGNGIGRHYHHTNTYLGLRPGHFGTSTNFTGSNETAIDTIAQCTIVGTGDLRRDYVLGRYNQSLYGCATKGAKSSSYSRNNRWRRQNFDGYWSTNGDGQEYNKKFGQYEQLGYSEGKYTGDTSFHDVVKFSAYHNSGRGLSSYNTTNNKFLYVETEAGGTAYEHRLKVYTLNADKNLRDFALGKYTFSEYNQDVVTAGLMTLTIDSELNIKEAYRADTTTTDYTTSDRYYGHAVLCDNDTVVHCQQFDYNASQQGMMISRYTKSSDGSEYEYDSGANKFWSGNRPYTSEYGAMSHRISNDGRYIAVFTNYYYYGSGISGTFIRVSDGAMLHFQYAGTSQGMSVISVRHNSFFFKRQNTSSSSYMVFADMDYMFGKFSDGTDVSTHLFNGTDHREYGYTWNMGSGDTPYIYQLMNQYNWAVEPIYNPYAYQFKYFDADGTLKSGYDKFFNSTT